MEQIRREYSQKDKELIEKYLEAKRIANLKSGSPAKGLDGTEALPSKLGMTDLCPLSLSLSLSLPPQKLSLRIYIARFS